MEDKWIDGVPDERRFKSPAEGLKELEASYSYWTSKITDISFQCCIALIAANWSLHSKGDELLHNSWALLSIGASLSAVVASLIGALFVSERAYAEFYAAERDRDGWRGRWDASERIPSEWPYTKFLVNLGRGFTWAKVLLPVVGGIFFVVGAMSAKTSSDLKKSIVAPTVVSEMAK